MHPRIAAWNMDGTPAACKAGYRMQGSRCVSSSSSNCQTYSSNGYCVKCQAGFSMDSSFNCIQGTNCANTATPCQCNTGFINVNGQCTRTQSAAEQSVYLQQGTFLQLRVNSGASEETLAWPMVSNCEQQDDLSGCKSCLFGFTLEQKRCVLKIDNCDSYATESSIYDGDGLCKRCLPGYTFWSGSCQRLNCASESGFCSSCPINFSYANGLCFANSVANCVMYNANGGCDYCGYGYYLSL